VKNYLVWLQERSCMLWTHGAVTLLAGLLNQHDRSASTTAGPHFQVRIATRSKKKRRKTDSCHLQQMVARESWVAILVAGRSSPSRNRRFLSWTRTPLDQEGIRPRALDSDAQLFLVWSCKFFISVELIALRRKRHLPSPPTMSVSKLWVEISGRTLNSFT